MPPRYLEELTIDELRERAARLEALMDPCVLCPHECGARRLHGETGECRSGAAPVVSSVGPHFGEEPPLVGRFGSGTIFLANCNLACVFCQNYDLSQFGEGVEASPARLADAMRNLQLAGCRNVNVVTPTHFAPAIVAALADAVESGFDLPLVYNCGGYESLRVLELLDGVIDIYMPDMKYADSETAKRYAGAADYPERNAAAVREMRRQVGDLRLNRAGEATRGLLVRHLVLPGHVEETRRILKYIAEELSRDTYVNVMDQYRPEYKARDYPPLARRLTEAEWNAAVAIAKDLGLTRGLEE